MGLFAVAPAMNRRAIFNRPGGTCLVLLVFTEQLPTVEMVGYSPSSLRTEESVPGGTIPS
jgi:hypothetical protein